MIKAVFVAPNDKKGIANSGANYLMVAGDNLKKIAWDELKGLGMDLSISIGAFGPNGCPANPESFKRLIKKIERAIKFKPDDLWIDHFRFDGHWEAIESGSIPGIHEQCQWCKGQDRVGVLKNEAQEILSNFGDKISLGYFAVPFLPKEVPQLVTELGQDHAVLGKIFHKSSPMLYHRMIKKPVSYISEYVKWLSDKTGRPVLPIIQITNMPDLETTLPETEIVEAYLHAKNLPSEGVALFWWTNAMLIDKTQVVHKLFSL